ncbi:hypothetical protein NW127_04880 [Staphylococcus pettenkoferi]|uniref:hypothetical protein n=1 Tax=Staphylococcus pettenkoferi TaxID=170573 RepID=UPI0022746A84|nr:hypothetical protein [Staphylococcus pettenkoferi]MCY1576008.1 hypothetical protein [Staphylococcus pettenkoferi]MCY1617726.1 hypothetical protein [Staphylococcus pettenkoferi]
MTQLVKVHLTDHHKDQAWTSYVEDQHERIELFTRYNYQHVDDLDIRLGKLQDRQATPSLTVKVRVNHSWKRYLDVHLTQDTPFDGKSAESSPELRKWQRYRKLVTVDEIVNTMHAQSVSEALAQLQKEGAHHD